LTGGVAGREYHDFAGRPVDDAIEKLGRRGIVVLGTGRDVTRAYQHRVVRHCCFQRRPRQPVSYLMVGPTAGNYREEKVHEPGADDNSEDGKRSPSLLRAQREHTYNSYPARP